MKERQETFGRMLVLAGLPMLCINNDAAQIWDLCDGSRTVSEIIAVCKEGVDIDIVDSVHGAVQSFLDEAFRLHLLKVELDTIV